MDTMESKIAHFQKTVRETLYNSVNRSDWDEVDIASEELCKLMYDNRSDIAAFNLLSDVLKMYQNARKECMERLGEAELGNTHFLEKNYQEATTFYTRSLIWNPKDSKVYDKRALCYMILEKMPQALDDAEKCIELDPKFSGGYFIKGSVQTLMNDYKKAFDTFQEGLKHNPTDKFLLGGVERCVQKIHEASSGDSSGDNSRKDKAAEGSIVSQQEKGESSSFENVMRQECANHNFRKDEAAEGTLVFQQEKGKSCMFNEHVIYNMPTVNPTLPTVTPTLPTLNPISSLYSLHIKS